MTTFQRSSNWVYKSLFGGEEAVLVPLISSMKADATQVLVLNETGSFIWEQLEQPKTKSDLKNKIAEEFDLTGEQIEADLDAYLSDLQKTGAISEHS